MKGAVRDLGELCRFLGLPSEYAHAGTAEHGFPLFVPRGYIARMRPADPHDPLLLQVLPTTIETGDVAGFSTDPVADRTAELAPGLLQKYAGRALLVTTGACAVHCRYCFRRHFPYEDVPKSSAAWQPAIDAIATDRSIGEVILSGGDPLTLVDRLLARLTERLAEIEHVRRLRVHTRLPIMIPERVTDGLLAWLTGTRLVPIVVVHANHAREIDEQVTAALGRLIDGGVPVLNQAVLLAGVNDTPSAQLDLWERLIEIRVMPYYLHLPDRVTGAAHFDVAEETGRQIIAVLRERLPGYAVPRLVREVPGSPSKVVVA